MEENLKQKVVKGTLWALVERFSGQAITFVVSMVLARLLTPTDYGTIALLSIFIGVAGVLADSGFGLALIQKKNISELEFNSVFYCSLVVTSTLYLILFFAAPWIADFYNTPVLVPVLRILSSTLILNSINSIQGAEISRNLKFNLSFKVSLIATITSAVIGISMAYMGYGVWALVWSQVISGIVGTIARWFIVKWRPKLMFSFAVLKPLFSFGWKMVFVNLLDTLYRNLYGFLIGKMYSKEDLAYVNKGQNQPNILMSSVEGTLARVTLPTFSKFQGDRERMVNAMRKMIVCSSFIVFPTMTIFAFTAYGQVKLMYGDQWLPIVPYIQIACFQMALYPFHNMNLQAIAGWGRTDLSLKIEIIKKIMSFAVVLIAVQFSVMALMMSIAFVISPLAILINSFPNRKLFGYAIEQQFKDVLPTICLCVLVGTLLYIISLFHLHFLVELFLQCAVGVISYLWAAIYFKVRGMKEYLNILGTGFIGKCPAFIQPSLYKIYNYIEK